MREYTTSVVRPGFSGNTVQQQQYATVNRGPVMTQAPAQTVNYANVTANYAPQLNPIQNYLPADSRPMYGYSPHIPGSGSHENPLYPNTHVHGSAHPKASERYITYYPYLRYCN